MIAGMPVTAGWTVPYSSVTVMTTEAVPEPVSVNPPPRATFTILWFGGQRLPGTAEMSAAGGVLSIFRITGMLAVFPALSTAVPVTICPSPSVETVTGPGQKAMPDKASLPSKVTVTFVLFQPDGFGPGLTCAIMTGGVLSIFTEIFLVAERPAASTAVPVALCPAPSDVSIVRGVQLTIPEPASLQVKSTATSVLFHPYVFGAGVAWSVMAGTVLSILTVNR